MASESSNNDSLPGLEGYRFLALQVDQRDQPVYNDDAYHQWGSFRVDTTQASVKLLLLFDSLTGPLRFSLPGVEKDAFQLGQLAARVIWLTISRPASDNVSFVFKSAMPAKLAQVLLLKDECAALPWPPPAAGAKMWLKENATFSTMGPSMVDGLWSVKLTIGFDGQELPAEFLLVCNCPREELEVSELSDSPRGAGCLIQPGPNPSSFIVTVRPSSATNYDQITLRLIAAKIFQVESVERLFRA